MHHVYIVQLMQPVMQVGRFARANPQYVVGKPCVYVGMTGFTPTQRLRNHLDGHRSSSLIRRHGKRLREDLIEGPMTRERAELRERDLAAELRARGWAVWQN